jgi:hypothetical protein
MSNCCWNKGVCETVGGFINIYFAVLLDGAEFAFGARCFHVYTLLA